MARGVLFLDRDGVLNHKAPDGAYISGPQDLRVFEGVPEALARITAAVPGVRTAIVTNQRGIARGVMRRIDVERTNRLLVARLAAAGARVDRIEICPHDIGECDCRKPGTAMLERTFAAWPDASPDVSAMVGDSASDILAGARMGLRTYLVGTDPRRAREAAKAGDAGAPPDIIAASIVELAESGALVDQLSGSASRPSGSSSGASER